MKAKYVPINFNEMDRMFVYCPETGNIFHKVNRCKVKAGTIATHRNNIGYLVIRFRRNGHPVTYLAHRVAYLLGTGIDPKDKEIDHLNRITTDNRLCNLELVTDGEHKKRQPKRVDNTSGVTGVSWSEERQKWVAQICIDKKNTCLGRFEDFFEAVCIRKSAENRNGYHIIHGKTDEEARKILTEGK